METTEVKKALAYITRYRDGEWQLLVYKHRDDPESDIHVPGGGVEKNEDEKEAAVREVFEETGLTNIEYVRRIGVYKYFSTYRNEYQRRFVYHFKEKEDGLIPDRWEYVVKCDGKDNGWVFQFFWLPIHTIVGVNEDDCDKWQVIRSDYLPDLIRLEKEN
ncbi:NUDIX hydrolase [Shouchella lonarensis]|uniref:8-oxo-dGTP pyrophosphatase MutT, NUDIX family n=1 Tax=Shouchella lonarensis TaxID=1464122 RepID=A0A1G6NGH8_9BACI|nr:NUDIX domain-containing protein [Shouchella lonarensis]SDC66397.1 8-oxo-dGTP pyrophosphatase MutT, NUDIX family [Shouchella lonarensis]